VARHPKVQFKVSLEELFGERLDLNQSIKESIGQAIIDRIVQRTSEDSIDRYGKSLGKYSKSYAKSLFGQVYGKKAGGDVTLLATGDMLGGMNVIAQTSQSITIGFDQDEQNTKAYGHVSGMQGHPTLEGKVKKRDFMGLPKSELDAIAAEFEADAKRIDAIQNAETRDQLDSAVIDIIAQLEGEFDGG
jgi:hypothetical protein